MAKKTVIAYFMHEHEEAAAYAKLDNIEVTESYLIGEIDEGDLSYLEEQGLIIQTVDEIVDEETGVLEAEPPPDIIPAPGIRGLEIAEVEIEEGEPNYYLIKLGGPLIGKWRSEIDGIGVTLLEHIPRDSYTAKMVPEQARAIDELSFVRSVRLYDFKETAPLSAKRAAPPPPRAVGTSLAKEMLTFDIRLHQNEDVASVLQWLEDHETTVSPFTVDFHECLPFN